MKKFALLTLIIILAGILRTYKLSSNPPSLYWDEVSLGYNAYSILKTGHDEHGKFMPITNFGAFGDYKPPGYIYTDVLPISIFGLNEFAVRFPSAFLGLITVFVTYLLSKKIFKKEKIAFMSAFFLSISPWHLQLSRVAFESNMALMFSILGIYFFIKFVEDNSFFILPSLIAFFVSMYTFTGQRLFVPFILLVLFVSFRKQLIKNLKFSIFSIIIFLALFYPLFKFATGTIEGRLRFNEVTIFNDLKPINDSISYRKQDNFSLISNILDNRRLFFAQDYLKHYFDAYNQTFLFYKGDVNPRLSVQGAGELYFFDLILIILGVYSIIKNKEKYGLLIFSWLLISPLGPATARETPHALRMAHIIPTFQLISAYGLFNLLKSIRYPALVRLVFATTILVSFFYYLHFYYIHYPKTYSQEWQYGYKEAMETIAPIYNAFDKVFISDRLGRAYIYTLFYLKLDPFNFYQKSNVVRDQFFFYNTISYEKFIFTDDYSGYQTQNSLFVASPNMLPQQASKIKTIYDLSGNAVFDIGYTK